VPLLLVDMDDTLVDRAATVDRWARRRLGRALPPRVAATLRRLHLHRLGSRLIALYEQHEVRSYVLEEGVEDALTRVRRAGWSIAVITNGNRRTQPAKIASARIAPLVDGVVISSHEGFAKPDPRVFRLAAQRAGSTLEGAWVVGDDLRQEIAGAAKLGLRSVWLNPRGLPASADVDLQTRTFPEAVALVLSESPVRPGSRERTRGPGSPARSGSPRRSRRPGTS
jgi:putative hydrolase of the HAD superfamily